MRHIPKVLLFAAFSLLAACATNSAKMDPKSGEQVMQRANLLLDRYARSSQAAPAVPESEVAPSSLSTEDALLWVSAANPAGGTLRLVQAAAEQAASRIDWSRR